MVHIDLQHVVLQPCVLFCFVSALWKDIILFCPSRPDHRHFYVLVDQKGTELKSQIRDFNKWHGSPMCVSFLSFCATAYSRISHKFLSFESKIMVSNNNSHQVGSPIWGWWSSEVFSLGVSCSYSLWVAVPESCGRPLHSHIWHPGWKVSHGWGRNSWASSFSFSFSIWSGCMVSPYWGCRAARLLTW